MQGLDGQADLSGDGFITASELAAYVGPTVSSLSRQTPAFGNLVGSEGGEFLLRFLVSLQQCLALREQSLHETFLGELGQLREGRLLR